MPSTSKSYANNDTDDRKQIMQAINFITSVVNV